MAQDDELSLATREDLITTLSFGLQFSGRKRTHHADSFMARIAAEHLCPSVCSSADASAPTTR